MNTLHKPTIEQLRQAVKNTFTPVNTHVDIARRTAAHIQRIRDYERGQLNHESN